MRRLKIGVIVLLAVLFSSIPASYVPNSSARVAQTKTEKKEVLVWVNASSGVYHCPGARWYGNTKRGKYLSECAAIKEGNRPAYGKACGSDCQPTQTATSATPSTNESTVPTSTQQAGNPDVKVWVNTNSGVYHCPGTRWYGNTKQGEFMSQKKAHDAGNHPAYGKVCQ